MYNIYYLAHSSELMAKGMAHPLPIGLRRAGRFVAIKGRAGSMPSARSLRDRSRKAGEQQERTGLLSTLRPDNGLHRQEAPHHYNTL